MNRDNFCDHFERECNDIESCKYFRDRFGVIAYCVVSDKCRKELVEYEHEKELQEREAILNDDIQ